MSTPQSSQKLPSSVSVRSRKAKAEPTAERSWSPSLVVRLRSTFVDTRKRLKCFFELPATLELRCTRWFPPIFPFYKITDSIAESIEDDGPFNTSYIQLKIVFIHIVEFNRKLKILSILANSRLMLMAFRSPDAIWLSFKIFRIFFAGRVILTVV